MATPIKRIEKDFYLKLLFDEQIPLILNRDQMQYTLRAEKPPKEEIQLRINRLVYDLENSEKLDLFFKFRGQTISFSAEIISVRERTIIIKEPEFLYKNLDRSFSRVSAPPDLQVKFSFTSDRYSLSYPKINEYEPEEEEEIFKSLDPRDLSGLINQMEVLIKRFATGYKIVVFKDIVPYSIEERVITETGRSLYIRSTLMPLPFEDPYPRKKLITEEMFKNFLVDSDQDFPNADAAYEKFLKQKHDRGVYSDLWMPILFQEYVIGYISVWIDKEGLQLFDYGVVDTLYQFAKILAHSLKINRYFESGKIKNDPFDGRIIDISASGLLFSYPISNIASTLLQDTTLSVELKTPQRTVKCKARIVRTFKDKFREYFGCIFTNMQPEDLRFFFEYIYGKTFTDKDAAFLSGQV